MYQYRKLSPEQREDIVRQRKARGYPLHAPPHPVRAAGCYLITAVNYEHATIMNSADRRADFETRLLDQMAHVSAISRAWVILPNHYHVLVEVASLDDVSKAIGLLHGSTSREWNLADSQTGRRRIWYKFTDRRIRDDVHFLRAMNYIHYNPVQHGLVGSPYDWPWSSVHDYLDLHGRDWLRQQWLDYRPDAPGIVWDE